MTITLTREEAQQVLDHLQDYVGLVGDPIDFIEILRTRLAQPEPSASVEPVATVWVQAGDIQSQIRPGLPPGTKLYTAPPQREWQELSDYDVDNIVKASSGRESAVYLAEAKLKEKNT